MKSSEPLSADYSFRILTTTRSDDDDEEEEGADQVAGASGSGEAVVKQEHADSAPSKKARQRTPSNELYIYSADELARFKKRDMLADSEYLDGMFRHLSHA
jgi:structural maintenance of chromosome 4